MAFARKYVCTNCRRAIEAWDDGNPYYTTAAGKKRYAYHPDKKRNQCIGNDSPHLCLNCGHEFTVDSRSPTANCPKCAATNIVRTFGLEGKPCPYCKNGTFDIDPDFRVIS
jgi:DNA-directed RNA polymerase subunit RPC12/RpoP